MGWTAPAVQETFVSDEHRSGEIVRFLHEADEAGVGQRIDGNGRRCDSDDQERCGRQRKNLWMVDME
jgi:hypothetical protein